MRSWISVLAAFIALYAFDAPAQQPPANLTGHYLTGSASGEGVFIEHQGNTAFLTFVSYDSTGQGTWFVMPDARGAVNNATSRFEFTGPAYKARRGDESPPSIHLTPLGNATFYSTGVDTIQFTTSFNGDQYSQYSRALRRYRF